MADLHLRIASLAFGLLLGACEASTPAPPVTPPPVVAPDATDFEGASVGSFRSKRFELTLPLPDGHAWRIDDHKASWLVATHAGSASKLELRAWAEEERANTKTCEAAARLRRLLPEREGAEAVAHYAVDAPHGFDTHADVLIAQATPAGEVTAYVLAFGGRLHKCFAFVYTTRASGADAEGIVGRRLAAMIQRSLRGVVAVDDLNPIDRLEPRER